jgi:LacI family transcriptional regulator
VSIRRIAALLKLSPAAVSMALHDHPRIPEATKRQVRRAARKLGYKPNAKVAELMSQVRSSRRPVAQGCFAVISFYEQDRPWEQSLHLARMYESMLSRADALGYRLEPIGMDGPGMTPRRVRAILDARGIEGILCFGSPRFDQEFPRELDHYAVVTQGWSIKTPLHRVINHGFNTTWRALEKVHEMGYRRPGMVLGENIHTRGAHANLSAYYGWCESMFGSPEFLPVLRLGDMARLRPWLKLHRPDAFLLNQDYQAVPEFWRYLAAHDIRVPQDLGVLAISQVLEGTPLSGFEENQALMGICAVELLVSRIMNRDLGLPAAPRLEMVECRWVVGSSLRPL